MSPNHIYTGHPGSTVPQPPLPEKRRQGTLPGSPNGRLGSLRPGAGSQQSVQHHVTFSPSVGEVALPAGESDAVTEEELGNRVSVKFVQDSSRFWYKSGISRDQGNYIRIFPKTQVLKAGNYALTHWGVINMTATFFNSYCGA